MKSLADGASNLETKVRFTNSKIANQFKREFIFKSETALPSFISCGCNTDFSAN